MIYYIKHSGCFFYASLGKEHEQTFMVSSQIEIVSAYSNFFTLTGSSEGLRTLPCWLRLFFLQLNEISPHPTCLELSIQTRKSVSWYFLNPNTEICLVFLKSKMRVIIKTNFHTANVNFVTQFYSTLHPGSPRAAPNP